MPSHIERRRARQPKVPTIGALLTGNISPEEFWRKFRQGLRDRAP
jgi:putative tryptophan/tyrosine transport system substrate-binding protein